MSHPYGPDQPGVTSFAKPVQGHVTGEWRPQADVPLMLTFGKQVVVARLVGLALVAFSAWCAWQLLAGRAQDPGVVPVGLAITGAFGLLGLLILLGLRRASRAYLLVGPRGIVMRGRPGVHIDWDEIAHVDVEVFVASQPRLSNLLAPARLRNRARITLRVVPALPDFGGRDDMRRLRLVPPAPPFTHGVRVPSPMFPDVRNIPVVRDLDAALRHFASGRYSGVHERKIWDDVGGVWGDALS